MSLLHPKCPGEPGQGRAHLLAGAVGPPGGRDQLLQACFLHPQGALDVKEDHRAENIEAEGRQGRRQGAKGGPSPTQGPPGSRRT